MSDEAQQSIRRGRKQTDPRSRSTWPTNPLLLPNTFYKLKKRYTKEIERRSTLRDEAFTLMERTRPGSDIISRHQPIPPEKHAVAAAMTDYIPDEVVVDILQRLPVKSLIRFRCVSKSWNSHITTPAFIHSHLNQSIPNNNPPHPLLIVRYCIFNPNIEDNKEHYKLFHDNEAFEECAELEVPIERRCLRRVPKNEIHPFKLIGFENGLICVLEEDRFVLWNPSIRKVVNLPKPCTTPKTNGDIIWNQAFGFDPRTNDYKVVRIACHSFSVIDAAKLLKGTLVEVYSVSTGSWRMRRIRRDSFLPLASMKNLTFNDCWQPKACLKGAVHFAAHTLQNGTWVGFVLSFDLRDEVFRVMILPDSMVVDSITDICTCVFRGSLALLCYDIHERKKCCSIWMMKEYGVVDSWVKQFTIDIAVGVERVLGFRKNGHIILETRTGRDWELSSYDPESQQVTKLGIHEEGRTFWVDTYRENLVLLNQANDVVSRSRVIKKRKNG